MLSFNCDWQVARYGGVAHVIVKNCLPAELMRCHVSDAHYFPSSVCGGVDVNHSTDKTVLVAWKFVNSTDLESWGAFRGHVRSKLVAGAAAPGELGCCDFKRGELIASTRLKFENVGARLAHELVQLHTVTKSPRADLCFDAHAALFRHLEQLREFAVIGEGRESNNVAEACEELFAQIFKGECNFHDRFLGWLLRCLLVMSRSDVNVPSF